MSRLSRIVISEDTFHKVIFEGVSQDLEVMENDQLNFKLRLRDRNPPCTIFIRHLDDKSAKNLDFYISTECREPNEY